MQKPSILISIIIAFFALSSSIWILMAGASIVGVSTDESTHVSRLKNYLTSGWYLPSGQLPSETLDSSENAFLYVYGPVAALWGHIVNVIFANESWGTVATTPEAYQGRHLSVAIIAIAMIAAGGGVGALFIRRFGFLAGAVAVAMNPILLGHGMFNNKDLPVAAGMTIVTFGLAWLINLSLQNLRSLNLVMAMSVISSGAFLAVGTRPGAWIFVLAQVAMATSILAYLFFSRKIDLSKSAASVLVIALPVAGFAVALTTLSFVYPRAFSDPADFFVSSFKGSSNYTEWSGIWLTAGEYHSPPPPLDYIPNWLVSQLPLVYLIGIVLMVAVILKVILRLPLGFRTRNSNLQTITRFAIVAMLLLQSLGAPLGAMLRESTLYSGLRQLLFIYPALSLLALFGLYYAFLQVVNRSIIRLAAAPILVTMAVIPITVDNIRIFPYNYSYFGEVITVGDVNRDWSTDYWRLSLREGLEYVDTSGRVSCEGVSPQGQAGETAQEFQPIWTKDIGEFNAGSCGSSQGDLFMANAGSKFEKEPLSVREFHWVTNKRNSVLMPENCVVEQTISRNLRGYSIIFGWVARCETP